MSEADRTTGGTRRFGWRAVITIAVCVAIIAGAGGVNYLIYASEPTAQSEGATRKSAALVETIVVTRSDYRPVLNVLGAVEPARDIMLSPQVSGRIIDMRPEFAPGGIVREDQLLLEIDPVDFQRVLTVREAEYKQVEADLAIEMGRQHVAKQEFELLGRDIDPENRSLVLREPQIDSIRAQLQASKAAVDQAKLDLDRTKVRAPFDAQILSRSTNIGSQVAPGDVLGRLVGVDEYWVMASVPLRDLRWLKFPEEGAQGSAAKIRLTSAWPPGVYRDAEVTRLIGSVDQQTRLARVLVTAPDPLARRTDGPPLILGTIVELQIEGRPFENVVRLDRDLVRQNDTVWIMTDGELEIRDVNVIYRDADHAFISEGLNDGDEIVTTNLATVSNGLSLRLADTPADADSGSIENPQP